MKHFNFRDYQFNYTVVNNIYVHKSKTKQNLFMKLLRRIFGC